MACFRELGLRSRFGKSRGRLRADLRASCGEGAAFGAMVGLGETYLPAFVLAAGLGELTAGLVGSLPLLAGGIMQMISPRAVRLLGSHKRWVVLCAVVQSLVFLPLVWAALSGRVSGIAVLAIAAVYWAAGLATGPAWNTWIGTVVPPAIRARFFAIRTRGQQAAVFAGFLLGGIALQLAGSNDRVMTVYAVLFASAGLFRFLSASLLALQSEPAPIPAGMRRIPWRELLRHLRGSSGGRLLIYLAAVQAAVQMAGPYFTPFMFEHLHLSYAQFVLLIAVAYLSKVIALPLWGRIGQRIGAHRLLWIGGIGIAPLGAAWLVSQHVAWLIAVQVTGGVTWAAYELAFFLLFFESIAQEDRTSLLTVYNLINTLAWVIGALIGGALLFSAGATFNGYLLIFTVSSVGRFLSLVLLRHLRTEAVETAEIGVRSVAVRPNSASLDAPVLPSLPDQTHEFTGHPQETPA